MLLFRAYKWIVFAHQSSLATSIQIDSLKGFRLTPQKASFGLSIVSHLLGNWLHQRYREKDFLMSLINQLFDYILPEKCALCHKKTPSGFCQDCQTLLPWKHCFCPVCSTERPVSRVCGQCQNTPPHYFLSAIPFNYCAPISDQIHQLKYQNQIHFAVPLAKMFYQWLSQNDIPLPNLIVPIPLHRHRINQRGFNQALEISRVLSKLLGVPFNRSMLSRCIDTSSQTGLSEKLRTTNVKQAFNVNTKTHYDHIALVDDVVTSGSTVNEAAKSLLMSGAASKISVWAITKT